MPRLLVIEDELEATNSLKEFFAPHGVEVLTAPTGEEGLELLASEKPELVLLDLKLGKGLSGLEVLRRAKASKTQTEFVVITAVSDRNIAEMAKGLGAAAYITKPFSLEALEHVVLSRLKKT